VPFAVVGRDHHEVIAKAAIFSSAGGMGRDALAASSMDFLVIMPVSSSLLRAASSSKTSQLPCSVRCGGALNGFR